MFDIFNSAQPLFDESLNLKHIIVEFVIFIII